MNTNILYIYYIIIYLYLCLFLFYTLFLYYSYSLLLLYIFLYIGLFLYIYTLLLLKIIKGPFWKVAKIRGKTLFFSKLQALNFYAILPKSYFWHKIYSICRFSHFTVVYVQNVRIVRIQSVCSVFIFAWCNLPISGRENATESQRTG